MAVIIPNAGDTTSGNKYESLDQAEPDALDFEILGNAYSGVLSGCLVSSNSSPSNVAVSAGTIVIDGVPYAVAANPTLALPAAPSDNRFDLVVARVSGGTASLTVVTGDDSGTNPSFPRSVNLITGSGSSLTNIDFSTDVVLAAILRGGSSSVTGARIVDKRAIRNAGIMFQGTAAPTVSDGVGTGQFYYDVSDQDGITSGVYVKKADGSFISLAADSGAHFPIGGVFAWPVNVADPEGCVSASGQSVSVSSYPALFAIYGYTFGGSGGSFNMPNLNDGYSLKGTATGGTIGTTTGEDTTTLTEANLPSHAHTLAGHKHTLVHDHPINHTHASSQGSHTHSGTVNTGYADTKLTRYGTTTTYSSWFIDVLESAKIGGWPTGLTGPIPMSPDNAGILWGAPTWTNGGTLSLGSRLPANAETTYSGTPFISQAKRYIRDAGHGHTWSTTGGTHSHSYTGSSSGASNTTTSTPTVSTDTGNVGSGTSFTNVSKSQYVKWMVRASLGDDPSYTGGTPSSVAAYEEVFVVEIYAEGETVIPDVSLGTSFRMPWPGTITNIRAATGVASTAGPIVIDVNEENGTLLSTKLTIDQDELSSTTAATPPVISDTLLADDSLIEFDVDNGGANAEGPLTVTLYITRSS